MRLYQTAKCYRPAPWWVNNAYGFPSVIVLYFSYKHAEHWGDVRRVNDCNHYFAPHLWIYLIWPNELPLWKGKFIVWPQMACMWKSLCQIIWDWEWKQFQSYPSMQNSNSKIWKHLLIIYKTTIFYFVFCGICSAQLCRLFCFPKIHTRSYFYTFHSYGNTEKEGFTLFTTIWEI